MTSAAVSFPGVTVFDRHRVSIGGDYRRALRRGAGIGFGTVTAAGGTAGAVTLTAVWMIAAAMSGAPHLPGVASTSDRLTLNRIDSGFAGLMISGVAPPSTYPAAVSNSAPTSEAERNKGSRLDAFRRVRFPRERFAVTPTDEGEKEAQALASGEQFATTIAQAASVPPSGLVAASFDLLDPEFGARVEPAAVAALPVAPRTAPPVHVAERSNSAPSSARAPGGPPQIAAPLVLADAEITPAQPQGSDARPAPHSTLTGFLRKLFGRAQASNDADATPAVNGHTAVYDIEAGVVYLPDGERLEAHSGLGAMMDDPHYVNKKGRGPTPPNVYDLVLREGSFHGVQAIRLKPVDDGRMFGRDGILAHPYMLGPTGQSFGCVSFKDYPRFLKAFEHGDVDRLVVVPNRDDYQRYAVND